MCREALELHLDRIEGDPVTFEQAWGVMWRQAPTQVDKARCYGAVLERVKEGPMTRMLARFTVEELRRHYDESRWDERTYVLVEEQIKRHRESGLRWNEQRALIPPVPKELVNESMCVSKTTPVIMEDKEALPSIPAEGYPFDPSADCVAVGSPCPDPQRCGQLGHCGSEEVLE
jgi:hypothetical protein